MVLCFVLCWRIVCCQPVLENYPVLPEVTILRNELIAVAASQVGIKEETGNNDGKAILKFQKAAGLKSGMAWCAAFTTWCHNACDIPNPESGRAANWFTTNLVYKKGFKRIVPFTVRRGQVAAETNGTRISHISIIEERINKTHLYTIGGNESNAVRRQLKRFDSLWAIADYAGWKEILKVMR